MKKCFVTKSGPLILLQFSFEKSQTKSVAFVKEFISVTRNAVNENNRRKRTALEKSRPSDAAFGEEIKFVSSDDILA